MKYERRGWRAIREGDLIKDPRGDRVIRYADRWGYSLEPSATSTDQFARYPWVKPWPKVGRLKVLTHIDLLTISVWGILTSETEVGLNITAGVGTPPEIQEIMVQQAITVLRHKHNGVQNVRAGDWRTITVPLDDVE